MFLIEGHTDAVGNDVDNLSLSDRRAESAATLLTQQFGVPAENLTSQGYGEQYLKEQTDGPSAINRRVTIRNITPLLNGGQASLPPPAARHRAAALRRHAPNENGREQSRPFLFASRSGGVSEGVTAPLPRRRKMVGYASLTAALRAFSPCRSRA